MNCFEFDRQGWRIAIAQSHDQHTAIYQIPDRQIKLRAVGIAEAVGSPVVLGTIVAAYMQRDDRAFSVEPAAMQEFVATFYSLGGEIEMAAC